MKYIILSLLLLTGCSFTKTNEISKKITYYTASIEETEKGVEFTMKKPGKVTMEKGDIEYTYDSKAESWFSKVMGILTLGAVGAK